MRFQNFNSHLPRLAAFVGLVLLLAAPVAPGFADESQKGLPVETLFVFSGDTEHRFEVEIAATDRQRSMGLMFREEMPADHGMLFLFEGEGQRYFWMKNTPLPLDIIYIGANGKIVSIAADTEPFSLDAIPSDGPAQYVLEVNAGIAKKLGITAGDRVESPSMGAE
ncbi:DUF192 domain-containing protein [Roseibium sediminicola]|uniref:DUF192 domain-containing protein n=1 Tax=Roseibium sediminicola TaxID=2933272 RepID=A0ABT0GRE9_9HYPH|nr:DUF192 domain-containing protein [Roseibium sp. CAU 1639]MCK7612002.1 DUF192 domain-containing protein [Roseibium sp. CAU 1639]